MNDERPSDPPAGSDRRDAIAISVAATVATFLVIGFAFDPKHAGSPAMLGALFGLDLSMAVYAVVRLAKRGEARRLLRLAPGDIWLGGMVAGLLYGGAMIGHLILTPHLSAREGWIIRLYLQLGDPHGEGREIVGGAVFIVAALEELAWRGLVQRSLENAIGPGRAVLVASVLFAVAHLPTLWLLGDPGAGPNPLIVLAAFGCSLVWGALVLRTKRLVPSIIAHALFSGAIVEFPIWRL